MRGVYESDEKQLTTYSTSNILIIPKESYVYTDYNFRFYVNQKEILYGKAIGKGEEDAVKNNAQLESALLAKKRSLEQVRTIDSLLSILNNKEYTKKDYESLLLSNTTEKRILKIEYLPEYLLQKINSINELGEVYNELKNSNKLTNSNLNFKSKSNSKSKEKKESNIFFLI